VDENRGLCVQFPDNYWTMRQAYNGNRFEGIYLYGWCQDDAATWTPVAVNDKSKAKWALFRPVKVTK
jgi:hypothetical protein